MSKPENVVLGGRGADMDRRKEGRERGTARNLRGCAFPPFTPCSYNTAARSEANGKGEG